MTSAPRKADGNRTTPAGGARIRSDIVDVYVFRRGLEGVEFLQLLRASEPLKGTWHPIMGHMEAEESAARTAVRETREEVGLDVVATGMWALEQVHPYYVAAIDCIVLSPRFAVEAPAGWQPRLNGEHSAARWVRGTEEFMWPGQRAAVNEILAEIGGAGQARDAMRVRM